MPAERQNADYDKEKQFGNIKKVSQHVLQYICLKFAKPQDIAWRLTVAYAESQHIEKHAY
jgi:hypothetical protein